MPDLAYKYELLMQIDPASGRYKPMSSIHLDHGLTKVGQKDQEKETPLEEFIHIEGRAQLRSSVQEHNRSVSNGFYRILQYRPLWARKISTELPYSSEYLLVKFICNFSLDDTLKSQTKRIQLQ
jgi:hypothetical protein